MAIWQSSSLFKQSSSFLSLHPCLVHLQRLEAQRPSLMRFSHRQNKLETLIKTGPPAGTEEKKQIHASCTQRKSQVMQPNNRQTMPQANREHTSLPGHQWCQCWGGLSSSCLPASCSLRPASCCQPAKFRAKEAVQPKCPHKVNRMLPVSMASFGAGSSLPQHNCKLRRPEPPG